MTFSIVDMGDGSFGVVSSANVFKTKDEAQAYVLRHCRNRDFGRRVQGEEACDVQVASAGRQVAAAFNKWARSLDRGIDKEDFKQVLIAATELCRVCRERQFDIPAEGSNV
jgi:hypothetical protein